MSQYHRLMLFLVISLFFHGGFYLGFRQIGQMQQSRKNLPLEVTIIDRELEQNKPQFVTDPEIGEAIEALNKQVNRLSKLTRRVKKEMVAKQTGQTQNRIAQQPTANAPVVAPKKPKASKLDLSPTNSAIAAIDTQKQLREQSYDQQASITSGQLPSTIAEYVPGVEEGYFTALNTNQFRYYAFFKRINEQIRLRWVENLRLISQEISISQANQLARIPRISKVELVLNKKGEFMNAFVDKSSGSKYLDQAAMNAFIDASPFLNPPVDLIDQEGFIRLQYSFVVKWKPRFIASDKGLGN